MPKPRQTRTRILFIGNSFTARNDLPELIADLAAARGIALEHRLLSIGGASLRTHWNRGEAQAMIESGGFQYVVLQEQSTLPIKNAARMRDNVLLFDSVIRDAGAKTVLYMTWARKNAPDTQGAITRAYESIGRETKALVVPVGEVWRAFLRKHNTPVLHDKDQSHPTLAGSYLAACVFVSSLFGANPTKPETRLPHLSDAHARLLRSAARGFR
jgi:hypothetical protein